ncbi:MAG: glycosyltransferase [Actinomycetaceae bacterium]|nr:glycosyltransferase [Actinomycetaceae bacterium]
MTDFSVLLPVYIGDNPAHFERSLQSVAADQTRPPSEVLVVCDGPVDPAINQLLEECSRGKRPDIMGDVSLRILRLPTNQGLIPALNSGLEACLYDIVARADADDISLPERFAEQIPIIEAGIDLVGSAIAEFEDDENTIGLVRTMPLTAKEICDVLPLRDPFNHPSVVYRRSAVAKVGGYEDVDFMEDYWLFARMVQAGIPCANHPSALVLYRVGDGAYDRRGGLRMLRAELTLQRLFFEAGITTWATSGRNLALRGGYRLVPSDVRRLAYTTVGRLGWFAQRKNEGGAATSKTLKKPKSDPQLR